jgi:CHASE3 domain sensor protein
MMRSLKVEHFYDPIAVISAIPVTIVVIVGFLLSYRSHVMLRQNRDLVVHTYQTIGAANDALVAAEDAETGQRGFIITGDEEFLDPYRTAAGHTIPARLNVLEKLLDDNPIQLNRATRLRELLRRKFEELAVSIQARRSKGFDASRSMVADQSGKRLMDQIRTLTAEMEASGRQLLAKRTEEVGRSERRIIFVAVFTALLSIMVRLAMAVWRQRLLNRYQQKRHFGRSGLSLGSTVETP